MRLATVVNDQC